MIDGKGFFYAPTIIAGAKQSDEIVCKEVFGPVVSVTRFDDEEQVVGWANESEYAWQARFGRLMSHAHCAFQASCNTVAPR